MKGGIRISLQLFLGYVGRRLRLGGSGVGFRVTAAQGLGFRGWDRVGSKGVGFLFRAQDNCKD